MDNKYLKMIIAEFVCISINFFIFILAVLGIINSASETIIVVILTLVSITALILAILLTIEYKKDNKLTGIIGNTVTISLFLLFTIFFISLIINSPPVPGIMPPCNTMGGVCKSVSCNSDAGEVDIAGTCNPVAPCCGLSSNG
jgi:hypothetical protein